ncbi:hypothetical protein HA402_003983 [Bradysia odoriphaga]|nr:hypothetical protein HA402_003983 [Bradysia odoriphaga]
MKAAFLVLFAVLGCAYCRSLPAQPSDIKIESLSGNPTPLVRRARQFGYGGYNNFDYNPYNDTPNNYDNNPFNDNARRTYNNFDFNPFNDSPNNYDFNPYNDSGFFGRK